MADAAVLLLLLVLSLSFSPIIVPVQAAADAVEQHEYTFVAISSLKPKAACSGHGVSPSNGHQKATWLQLSLSVSHGPCSPPSSPSHRRKEKPPPLAYGRKTSADSVMDSRTAITCLPL